MEIYTQIKKYRVSMNLSQEELAEKVYVTRQTVSNWENNKNYPDIHSLLLLSSLFSISLDQLIKGDIKIMKKEIDKRELQKLNQNAVIYALLLVVLIVSAVPLSVFLGYYGLVIIGILFLISLYFAIRIEKFKKDKDIQTYKEVLYFTEGKRLDEIEKAQEYGKRPYQKILYAFVGACIAFVVCLIFLWVFKVP